LRKVFYLVVILMPCILWKEHKHDFNNQSPSSPRLTAGIAEEGSAWVRAGFRQLLDLLQYASTSEAADGSQYNHVSMCVAVSSPVCHNFLNQNLIAPSF
jgi:hypothetical protein